MLPTLRCRAPGLAHRSRTQSAQLHCKAASSIERAPRAPAHTQLLGWATGKNLLFEHLPVAIRQHPDYGRCLVAEEDIAADAVVLSVCTDKVFMSQAADELEMHWAAEMAFRLLEERHACRSSSAASSSSNGGSSNGGSSTSDGGSGCWQQWIDSLPLSVVTPVEFTTEEVEQLVLPSTVQAVLNMRACLEHCYSELQQQLEEICCGWQDFLWAVQVLHSRCFYDPGSSRHLAVPGIDMSNHSSSSPNATVRLLNSPGACQGLAALQEVAPAAAEAASSSYFQLLAGPEGIQAGEQVCITYGRWPAEPFLLLFGFVPQPNPADSLVLYSNLKHMAGCYIQCALQHAGHAGSVQQPSSSSKHSVVQQQHTAGSGSNNSRSDVLQVLLQDAAFLNAFQQQVLSIEQQQQQQEEGQGSEGGGGQGFMDLIVNTEGVDARLGSALASIHQAVEAAALQTWQQLQLNSSGSQLSSSAINSRGDSQAQQCEAVKVLQLPLGTVLLHRLQDLASELEQSYLDLQQQQQSAQSGQGVRPDQSLEGSAFRQQQGLYAASAAHVELIMQYCSTKAALARQLAAQYAGNVLRNV